MYYNTFIGLDVHKTKLLLQLQRTSMQEGKVIGVIQIHKKLFQGEAPTPFTITLCYEADHAAWYLSSIDHMGKNVM